MRFPRGAAIGVSMAAVLGCNPPSERFPAPPACEPGASCGSPIGAVVHGGGTSGDGSSGTGREDAVDVTGEVGVALTAELDQVERFAGAARIFGPGPKGTEVEALYEGSAGSSFTLQGVLSGDAWLFVQDDTAGGAGVFSTFSLHPIPAPTPLLVPVLDQAVLEAIAQAQPTAPLIDPARAQILLALTRGAQPAAGISVTSGGADALVVYDQGKGIYGSDAAATGAAGIVLLLNAFGPSGGGTLTIQLTDAAATPFKVSVPVAPGAATIGQFALP